MGKVYGMAEFKAHCTRIVAELERTGEPVTLTIRGRPVAELQRVEAPRAERLPVFGFMKGSITFLSDDDNFSALDPDWEEQWEKKWEERGFPKR